MSINLGHETKITLYCTVCALYRGIIGGSSDVRIVPVATYIRCLASITTFYRVQSQCHLSFHAVRILLQLCASPSGKEGNIGQGIEEKGHTSASSSRLTRCSSSARTSTWNSSRSSMIKDWPGLSSNVTSICFTAESLGKETHRS
jgi:hypothetical protein